MPIKKPKKRPFDSARINIHEEYELHHWTEHFRVTKEELIQAINAVGDSAARVHEYLRKHKHK